MKKIVPFTKELVFKNGISEITSITLDNTLKLDKNLVTGEFIISGTYKMIGGDLEEEFKYNIPSFVTIDTKYDTTNCQVSIDDFSYEIINEEKLRVNISLMLDDLDIKEDEIEEIKVDNRVDKEYLMLDNNINDNIDVISSKNENDTNINNNINVNNTKKIEKELFTPDDTLEYSIYRVYTMKDDDTLEYIYEKYNVNKEILAMYNDLDNLKVGSKIIIPSVDE